jgi:ribosomal protein L34E
MDFFEINIHRCVVAGSVADGIKKGRPVTYFGLGVTLSNVVKLSI